MKAFFLLLIFANTADSLELIAHRGVHQTYRREKLNNETCTAQRIHKTGHSFMENTIESIEESFRLGADTVELDIHPTKSADGKNHLVVFHDWTLDCRTNASCSGGCNCSGAGTCVTHEQTLEYIQGLDLGHGYSYDEGKTFPFRGKSVGRIPTFRQVLSLLEKYPDKSILVNQKDSFKKTVEIFTQIISEYPESIRSRVMFPRFVAGFDEVLNQLSVPESIYQSKKAKVCLKEYVLKGWYKFPTSCKGLKIFIPLQENLGRLHPWLNGIKATNLIWGWPDKFITRAHQHGSKVYASQVDSISELEKHMESHLDGVMTNKIEVIGPHLKKISTLK